MLQRGAVFAGAPPARPLGRIKISTYDGRLRSSCYDESRPLIAGPADVIRLLVREGQNPGSIGPCPWSVGKQSPSWTILLQVAGRDGGLGR